MKIVEKIKKKIKFKSSNTCKRTNNKGFSLVELLLAIIVLAIVMGPMIESFISSARLNRNSRRLMVATNVAQTITEGFTNKDFEDIKSSISAIEGGGSVSVDLIGPFSSVSGNIYNMSANYRRVTSNTYTADAFSGNSTKAINYITKDTMVLGDGTIINNTDLINGTNHFGTNSLSVNSVSFNNAFEREIMLSYRPAGVDPLPLMVCYHSGALEKGQPGNDKPELITIGYTAVKSEGYTFDVIITLFPIAHDSTTKYYTYNMCVSVYDAAKERDLLNINPVISYTSGLNTYF